MPHTKNRFGRSSEQNMGALREFSCSMRSGLRLAQAGVGNGEAILLMSCRITREDSREWRASAREREREAIWRIEVFRTMLTLDFSTWSWVQT